MLPFCSQVALHSDSSVEAFGLTLAWCSLVPVSGTPTSPPFPTTVCPGKADSLKGLEWTVPVQRAWASCSASPLLPGRVVAAQASPTLLLFPSLQMRSLGVGERAARGRRPAGSVAICGLRALGGALASVSHDEGKVTVAPDSATLGGGGGRQSREPRASIWQGRGLSCEVSLGLPFPGWVALPKQMPSQNQELLPPGQLCPWHWQRDSPRLGTPAVPQHTASSAALLGSA